MAPPTRIAVLGCGPSGIMALRAFKGLADAGKVEITAFEKQSTFGGQWNYSDATGQDRWGEPVPGSMYRNLWINGPAEAIEVPDFPFDDTIQTYVPREKITDWWSKYVAKFDLKKRMHFDTRVNRVSLDPKTGKFTVETQKFGENPQTADFDYVLVCTGHFSFPHDPDFKGQDSFPGRILHAHNFRNGGDFKGLRVLCIGGSYSAEDVALQCWKFGATSATVTCRRPLDYDWPEGMHERPILTSIDGSTVTFADGSKGDYDVIIKCTGYKHEYPFLDPELQLITTNKLSIPLYRQTVHPSHPHLMFLGMTDQYFTFQMFWAQAHFCAKIVNGDIALPSKEAMLFDIDCEAILDGNCKTFDSHVDFQAKHTNYFTEAAGLPNVDIGYILKSWHLDKIERPVGIVNFRDKKYNSHFTGKASQETGWGKTFDKKK